ncbi:MAG: hypothetical protein MI921_12840, partial [Cytophagales bacterium]|nr:hypothetical protein [Cytophagales bacterium]
MIRQMLSVHIRFQMIRFCRPDQGVTSCAGPCLSRGIGEQASLSILCKRTDSIFGWRIAELQFSIVAAAKRIRPLIEHGLDGGVGKTTL